MLDAIVAFLVGTVIGVGAAAFLLVFYGGLCWAAWLFVRAAWRDLRGHRAARGFEVLIREQRR
jgi:hypothetical protein